MLLRLIRLYVFAAGLRHSRGLASARRPRKGPIHRRRQARHDRSTEWGTQPLSYHRQRSGAQVHGRRWPLRPAMVRHHADRQQTHQADVEAACVVAREALAGLLHRGWLAAKPDGRRGAGACRQRTRDPRHQQSWLGWRPGVRGLHPHAQQGHHGSVWSRPCRYAGGVSK